MGCLTARAWTLVAGMGASHARLAPLHALPERAQGHVRSRHIGPALPFACDVVVLHGIFALRMAKDPNNTLVALVPSRRGWDLVRTQGWYRIPVCFGPPMVKDGTIEHIAFYFPSVFGEEKHRVQWYSPVTGLEVRKRVELFANEPTHKHAHWDYYVVRCAGLRHLPHIIHSTNFTMNYRISTRHSIMLSAGNIRREGLQAFTETRGTVGYRMRF